MHACLTAAVINHCLEDYWRNVLVWAHSPVYLTGCSNSNVRWGAQTARPRSAGSKQSSARSLSFGRWPRRCVCWDICCRGFLPVWPSQNVRLLEFKSVVNSHNEKLFKLLRHIIPLARSGLSAQLILQIWGPATGGSWAPGSAARPCGGFNSRTYIHNRDFYLSPFPHPCVITPPASLLKWMEVRTFHILHQRTNMLVVIVTAVKSELVPGNRHPNCQAVAVKTNQEKGTSGRWFKVV